MIATGRARRRWLAGVAGLLGLSRVRAEDATTLPRPASLRDEAIAAGRHGDPLVLLVSLPGCPF